jgi:hypothetical protein
MKQLLQAKDVAEILNCSESHVYQLDKRGLLPCSVKWSCDETTDKRAPRKMRRWTEDDVERFLAKFANDKNSN